MTAVNTRPEEPGQMSDSVYMIGMKDYQTYGAPALEPIAGQSE
jgi:hypothetical protein